MRRIAAITFSMALLASAIAVCGLAGCAPQKSESWTVCLYVCGSDLETKHARATNTLAELCEADLPENVTVVVQTGGARTWRTDAVNAAENQRFVVRNHVLEEVSSEPARSMGSADTLADFLTYCAGEYPADHTAVVFWDHGGGPTKGVCFDEKAGYDALTLSELDEALAAGRAAQGGGDYDIIGFDACLMASLEVASTCADDGRYLVASEEIEPGAGWDYTVLASALRAASDDAGQVAQDICDGYLAKCEARGNGASATLSVVDLSRAGDVVSALDAAAASLDSFEVAQDGLFFLASGVRSAESFGGSSQAEGKSNLVDLHGIAHTISHDAESRGESFAALDEALEGAIVYSVAGNAVADASGLSIYYPVSYDRCALSDYASATPLSSYAATLERLFAAGSADIAFSDAGSVSDAGELQIAIAAESLDDVYDLYVETTRVDGAPLVQTDVDIGDDWEGGTFRTSLGAGACMTLDGLELDARLVEAGYKDNYLVYTAPITVNGSETNLRFAWIYDDEESAAGHYEILGTWNGIDRVTGLSDRSLVPLTPGDVVGALSSSTGRVRGEVTVGEQTCVSEAAFAPGTYQTRFIVVDLYGGEHPGNAITWTAP